MDTATARTVFTRHRMARVQLSDHYRMTQIVDRLALVATRTPSRWNGREWVDEVTEEQNLAKREHINTLGEFCGAQLKTQVVVGLSTFAPIARQTWRHGATRTSCENSKIIPVQNCAKPIMKSSES